MSVSGVSNWGSLTADQIKEYVAEGVDVPDEYEEWAESTTSTETYDNCEAETSASSTDSSVQYIIENSAGDKNEAEEMYNDMKDSVSLLEIADVFTKKCAQQEDIVTQYSQKLEEANSAIEEISSEMESSAGTSVSEINDLQTQLDSAVASSAKETSGEGQYSDVTEIQEKISDKSNSATTQQNSYSQKYMEQGFIAQNSSIVATDAAEYANETLKIADECFAKAGKKTDFANTEGTNKSTTTTTTTTSTSKASGSFSSKNMGKGAAIGATLGTVTAIGIVAATATTETLVSGATILVSGITAGAALGIIGLGFAVGALLGGIFGSSKKKKYQKAGQETEQAGSKLAQNSKTLDSKAESSTSKIGVQIRKSDATKNIFATEKSDATAKANSATSTDKTSTETTDTTNSDTTTDKDGITTDTDDKTKKKTT